jgi:hypothetical protein
VTLTDSQIAILRDYSAGRAGTRDSIERLDFRDHADLIIALTIQDLPFPAPRPRRAMTRT